MQSWFFNHHKHLVWRLKYDHILQFLSSWCLCCKLKVSFWMCSWFDINYVCKVWILSLDNNKMILLDYWLTYLTDWNSWIVHDWVDITFKHKLLFTLVKFKKLYFQSNHFWVFILSSKSNCNRIFSIDYRRTNNVCVSILGYKLNCGISIFKGWEVYLF